MSDSFRAVASTADIPRKACRSFTVNGQDIVIAHTKRGFFALENTCSHAEARLSEGRLRGFRLICPLHGAAFDVRDGRALRAPAYVPLRRFPLRIVDDKLEVCVGADAGRDANEL